MKRGDVNINEKKIVLPGGYLQSEVSSGKEQSGKGGNAQEYVQWLAVRKSGSHQIAKLLK